MHTNRFISIAFSSAFLAGALSCALLEPTRAAPNTQRGPVSGPIRNGGRNLPEVGKVMVGEPIPLMTDMLNYARTGNIASGTKAAVYATIVIASSGSGFKAGSSKTSYANGALTLAGAKGKEHFEGRFLLAQNSGDASAPFRASRATYVKVRIYQNGRVSLTTTVPLKNASGVVTTFTSNGADGFLWGRDTTGSPRLISISFSKGTASTSGKATPPPKPPEPPKPSAPRGMKVRVGGEIRVTNSDDGVADGTVEMFGDIAFNGQERWRVKRPSARDQNKGDVILLDPMTVDVYFDNASTSILKVTGTLRDRDMHKGEFVIKGDDAMWNIIPKNHTFAVDLKQMVETQSGKTTLYGDGDSENANVVVTVSKLSDIY